MAQENAFNYRPDDLLFFRIEPGDSFELQAEFVIGAAFVFAEQQQIEGHAERNGELSNNIEGRLRTTGFVSFQLLDVAAGCGRSVAVV